MSDKITQEKKVAKRRQLRDRVIRWLYEDSEGKVYPSHQVDPSDIATELDENIQSVASVLKQLNDEGIVKASLARGHADTLGIDFVGITSQGLRTAEETISPTNSTDKSSRPEVPKPSPNLIAGVLYNLAKNILVTVGFAAVLATLKRKFPSIFGTD